LHITQQMPLPLTISCSSKSRLVLPFLVLPFWYLLTRVVPDKFHKSSKTIVCVCVTRCMYVSGVTIFYLHWRCHRLAYQTRTQRHQLVWGRHGPSSSGADNLVYVDDETLACGATRPCRLSSTGNRIQCTAVPTCCPPSQTNTENSCYSDYRTGFPLTCYTVQ